ncbi:HD-GYP domain-containing protein [Saliterribacillus persicus]|nr:HD-GYP domain-containing protein [Saliterribacillus persicus]
MNMLVHPEQLISGCRLIKEVQGKTQYPLVPSNTIVDETQIEVLKFFLVEKVEVSDFLVDGRKFKPKAYVEKEVEKKKEEPIALLSFEESYQKAVEDYKLLFASWQNGSTIKMNDVRKVIVPLIEMLEEKPLDLFLLQKLSTKEDYFYHHGVAVGLISAALAKKLNFKKEWIQIGLAGLLADCGMSKMSPAIFYKKERLTSKELEEVKQHPTISYRMIEKVPSLAKEIKLAVLQHHERLDGTGYPLGVDQEKIHLFSKILAISDTYHAMTSERAYQHKKAPFKVMEEMMHLKYSKYDHHLLQMFIETLANYTTGTKVKLSTGEEAEIVFLEIDQPTRPIVKLLRNDEIIALKTKQNIYIESVI